MAADSDTSSRSEPSPWRTRGIGGSLVGLDLHGSLEWSDMTDDPSRVQASYSGPIHTLNARDSLLLDVMRDYFKLDANSVFAEIRGSLAAVTDVLSQDGVQYHEMRTALVPQATRKEIAYVFDSNRIESGWYGYEVHDLILRELAGTESRHSVLSGDLLGLIDQDRLRRLLVAELQPRKELDYKHSTQYYLVYLNNLSPHAATTLDQALRGSQGYVGYLDVTYSSFLKLYLSTVIGATYVIHGRVAIVGHEDDVPNTVNQNTPGFPFEAHGFRCVSLQSMLFDLFMSYKIEAPVLPGFESDTEFSLNAITKDIRDLRGFRVHLAPEKFEYLIEQKSVSLSGLGISGSDRTELEELIRVRLQHNYLYNLEYVEEHGVVKFNVMLEAKPHGGQPFKALAALEYLPAESSLRVITVY